MAGAIVIYHRNYNSSDTTKTSAGTYISSQPCPTIDTIGWSAPSGKSFKEWNTSRDGSGTSMNPGTTYDGGDDRYAIWQDDPTEYLTNDQEITSIADAIRAKGGTSAQLVYPAGFVSAIGAITTPYPSANGVSFGTGQMIDFMIVSRTNQAESGMTWEQWISSAYNVYGYVLNGNYISSVPSQGNLAYNGTDEVKTNTIVENRVYTWHLPK